MRHITLISLLCVGIVLIAQALRTHYQMNRAADHFADEERRMDSQAKAVADPITKQGEQMAVESIIKSMETDSPSTTQADRDAKRKAAEAIVKSELYGPAATTQAASTKP